MKIISLLKAVLTEDMNMFKYSSKKNTTKFKKMLLPIFLFLVVVSSILIYSILIGTELNKVNLNYVLLTMFVFIVTSLTFIQGIYKSQSILFEAKDNDLLFSLPIKKSHILFVRIFKLLLFQFIYNLMFLLPAFIAYIYFEHPSINFYIISIIYSILIPIIPTVISSLIGYIVKLISSKSKSKKIIQSLVTCIVFLGIFLLSFNLDSFVSDIAKNANSINDMITKIYYPVGLYINLITNFNLLDLIKLLLVNIIPLILFIIICQHYYFKIISNSKNISIKSKKYNKDNIKVNKKVISLVKKELNRFTSSVTLMFNSGFALFLLVIVSVLLCIKGSSVFDYILSNYGIETDLSINILYYFLIMFTCMMTSITSSSISLEGKTINITKSMPISEKDILKSKILLCYVIEIPFIIVSLIIFIIKFNPSLIYILSYVLLAIFSILFTSSLGLIANLKYPKMEYSSDVEVVKQSTSVMISVFSGMAIFILSILTVFYFNKWLSLNILLIINLIIVILLSLILYSILLKTGPKEYKNINV